MSKSILKNIISLAGNALQGCVTKKNNNSNNNNNKNPLKTQQCNVSNERAAGMWLRNQGPWIDCTWDDCLCVVGAVSEDVGPVVHKLHS